MKLKYTIPTVMIGLSSLVSSCECKVQRVVERAMPSIELNTKFQEIVTDTFSHKISDETKIISYNKLMQKYGKSSGNYIVVDKKNCVAKVYSPDGHVLYKTEVAVGRNVGDKRGGGYRVIGAKLVASTTPGEFFISREGAKAGSSNERLYGNRVLILSGDHTQEAYKRTQVLALHQVPKTPMGKLRANVFNNGTIKDNRVSYGCVNFLPESFDTLRSFIKGKGTKVYILPEEKGNSLHLEKQKDGSYKFFQTKYRYESQEPKIENKSSLKVDSVKKDTLVAETLEIKDLRPIEPIKIESDSVSNLECNDLLQK